jgi:hypothetical protein
MMATITMNTESLMQIVVRYDEVSRNRLLTCLWALNAVLLNRVGTVTIPIVLANEWLQFHIQVQKFDLEVLKLLSERHLGIFNAKLLNTSFSNASLGRCLPFFKTASM